MRDLDRWKDKVELQLDGRQIFFLFFGSAIGGWWGMAGGVVLAFVLRTWSFMALN